MSHAPPLPRKPASYSPTFLARADCALPSDLSLDQAHSSHRESFHAHDRHFALDRSHNDAAMSRSRPNSQGSAYGRPLPSPPFSQRSHVRMPEPDSSFAYDGLLDDYEYDNHSRSHSQTTLGTYPVLDAGSSYGTQYGQPQRPLPQAPQDNYPDFTNAESSYDRHYYSSRFESPIRIYQNGDDPYHFEDNLVPTSPGERRDSQHEIRYVAGRVLPQPQTTSHQSYRNPDFDVHYSNHSIQHHSIPDRHSFGNSQTPEHQVNQSFKPFASEASGRSHLDTHLRSLSHDVQQLEVSPQQHTRYSGYLPGDENPVGAQVMPVTMPLPGIESNVEFRPRYTQENIEAPSRRSHVNMPHVANPFEHVWTSSRESPSNYSVPEQINEHGSRQIAQTDIEALPRGAEDSVKHSKENIRRENGHLPHFSAHKPIYNQSLDSALGPNKTLPSIRPRSRTTSRPIRDFSRSHTVSERALVRDPLPHSLTNTSTQINTLLPIISKNARKLASADYELCREVWSRRALFAWLKVMDVSTEDEVVQSCVGLFTHNVPTLSNAIAHNIAVSLLQSFISQAEIVQISGTTKALRLAPEAGDGVLPTFSNSGCYSSRCHTNVSSSRCYSSRCSRTIPVRHERPELSKVVDANDWAQFWGLQADHEPLLSLDKREVQRQYQIHEVIYSESDYVNDLKVLRDVFQHKLKASLNEDQDFAQLVFGELPRLIALAKNELEEDLSARQAEQGPVITNIGDIFLSWIKRAAPVYIRYAASMGYADRAVRSRKIRSPIIREWLVECEADPRTKKLGFSSFHGSPTRRMQRYALLLGDVLKRTPESCMDYTLLTDAISEIKKVCTQCNSEVQLAQDKIALSDLGHGLNWQVPMKDLNLDDPSRELRHRGNIQRKSESHTSWQQRELILLDNFFLCLKPSKDGAQKVISRNPIPVEFLIVDDHEEVLSKSSSSRILGGTITHTISPAELPQGRKSTFESSVMSIKPADGSVSPSKSAAETLFPFSVRHAGRPEEKMTFYAESPVVRNTWITAIQLARSARWSKVANREPFRIHVLADETFGSYSHYRANTLEMPTTTNAVEAVLSQQDARHQKVLSKARVYCSTIFIQDDKREVCMLGTDDGIYCNDSGTWTQIIAIPRVTQIAVLEEFGVLTVLSDKMLIAYNLEDVLSTKTSLGSRKAPQKLSGKQNVGFFEVGLLKGRMLVIYKKRDNSNSVFKALEPVIGRKQEKKTFFRKGSSASSTDFFRDFDQFFIPTECYGMQFLRTTICIKCSRGFEVMSLDSKQPVTIPDLSSSQTASLRNRISGAKPLGTYRVQEGEFLCCYAECGLFVDPSGSICRPYTLEWEGHPEHAVLLGNYVVAVGKEFIEIWNVEKRALRQVITGHDIRCLPLSSAGGSIDMSSRGIMIAMTHPLRTDRQLIFELQLVK